jgi:hypothetical protein
MENLNLRKEHDARELDVSHGARLVLREEPGVNVNGGFF